MKDYKRICNIQQKQYQFFPLLLIWFLIQLYHINISRLGRIKQWPLLLYIDQNAQYQLSYVESMTQLFFMMLWAMVLRHTVSKYMGHGWQDNYVTIVFPIRCKPGLFDLILAHRHRRHDEECSLVATDAPTSSAEAAKALCIVYTYVCMYLLLLYTIYYEELKECTPQNNHHPQFFSKATHSERARRVLG